MGLCGEYDFNCKRLKEARKPKETAGIPQVEKYRYFLDREVLVSVISVGSGQ
jgi:hypothetical protein